MVYTTCKNGKLVGKCYIFLEPCSNKAGVAIALPSRHQPHRPWRRGYSCLWNTSGQPSQGSTYTPFGGVENIGLTIRSPQEDHSKMETATPMPHAFLEHPVQPVPYASTRLNRAQRSRGSPQKNHTPAQASDDWRWPRFLRPGIPLWLCQQFAIENGHWLIFVQSKWWFSNSYVKLSEGTLVTTKNWVFFQSSKKGSSQHE